MLDSILIGIDGSEDGESAVAYGIDCSKRFNATAVGIGIIDELGIFTPEPILFAECHYDKVAITHRRGNRNRVEEGLLQFVRSCKAAGVEVESLRVGGLACEQIIAEARNHSLTVLGQQTHFYDGWEERCDETLRNVLHRSPGPVVVVPRKRAVSGPVVIAFDGSNQAIGALEAFERTLLDRSEKIHVVSVAPDWSGASRQVGAAIASLRSRGINAHPHPVVTVNSPSVVLLELLHGLNAGLIVMGTYGRPSLQEFFIGSVTSAILRESEIPIFCFH